MMTFADYVGNAKPEPTASEEVEENIRLRQRYWRNLVVLCDERKKRDPEYAITIYDISRQHEHMVGKKFDDWSNYDIKRHCILCERRIMEERNNA